jgi:hypothetical protein
MHSPRARFPLLLAAATTAATMAGGASVSAAATSCQGAPGASALEQYCEAIPRGDGGRQTTGAAANPGDTGAAAAHSHMNHATAQALAAAGADGAAIRQLANNTNGPAVASTTQKHPAQPNTKGTGAATSSDTSTASTANPKDPSGSPLRAARQAASSGPAAGQPVAWGIFGISVLGAASALGRRRPPGTLPAVGDNTNEPHGD